MWNQTYWAILGATILQGPHQVAYQSTNTTLCLASVSLKSLASLMLWTVMLGNEGWKERATVSLGAVDGGMDDRIAVVRTGRRSCLVVDIDERQMRAR